MCKKNILNCVLERKEIKKIKDIDSAIKKMEQCEDCVYKKEEQKSSYQIKTYEIARLSYIEKLFWINFNNN